ncbi:MAG: LCP family glycopolymer transferase [Anaerolineales bacterium]
MQVLKQFKFDTTDWLIMLGVFVIGGVIAASQGLFRPTVVAEVFTPIPATTSLGLATAPTARTVAPTRTVARNAAPTATSVPAATAIPQATATWFYIAPAVLEFAPTPVLPPAAAFPTSCDGPGRMNIMLVGIDGFSGNYNRPARSDTIIVAGVNFAAKTAQLISFPRDLWVALPGGLPVSEARINTAYNYGELYGVAGGGPAELKAVLENTFGLRIDRYVIASFPAFEQAIDAIGGVEVDVPYPIRDPNYPMRSREGTMAIEFPEGLVQMDGGTALIYARIRHDSNDFNRMRRQQQILFAARDKLLQPSTLPHLPALAQVIFNSVRTDLSFEDLALLGCLGPQIDRSNIQTWVIDSKMVDSRKLEDGAQVLFPRMDAIQPVLQAFNVGE